MKDKMNEQIRNNLLCFIIGVGLGCASSLLIQIQPDERIKLYERTLEENHLGGYKDGKFVLFTWI